MGTFLRGTYLPFGDKPTAWAESNWKPDLPFAGKSNGVITIFASFPNRILTPANKISIILKTWFMSKSVLLKGAQQKLS